MRQTERDFSEIRKDFPILEQKIYGRPLIYLDNAATTQMPVCVMDALREHYCTQNANVHRGIHYLSERSTLAAEAVREKTAAFLSAKPDEIIFTSGATDSLNMVAAGYVLPRLAPGKKVITTQLEHHSNFVPWQQAAFKTGADFVVIPLKDDNIDLDRLENALDENTVLLSVAAVSNVTGVALPLREIISLAHEKNVPICIDAAQAMRHGKTDVRDLDCEFLAFSAHKMMGPTGVGVLFGKKNYLEEVEPVRFGGGMVDFVSEEAATFVDLPFRLEAGTPNYPGIIAFRTALDYLEGIGPDAISRQEQMLTDHLEEVLRAAPHVRVLGGNAPKKSVVSVTVDGVHPYDLSSFLDKFGVATRSGSHCAQPMVRSFGCDTVLRFSVAFYNTIEEIDAAANYLEQCIALLRQ